MLWGILQDIRKSERPTRKSYETKPVLQILTKNWFGGVCICVWDIKPKPRDQPKIFLSDVHTLEGGLREKRCLFMQ